MRLADTLPLAAGHLWHAAQTTKLCVRCAGSGLSAQIAKHETMYAAQSFNFVLVGRHANAVQHAISLYLGGLALHSTGVDMHHQFRPASRRQALMSRLLAPFRPRRDAKDMRLLSQRLQGTARELRLAYPLLHALIPSGPHSLPGPGSATPGRPVMHHEQTNQYAGCSGHGHTCR